MPTVDQNKNIEKVKLFSGPVEIEKNLQKIELLKLTIKSLLMRI